MKKQNLSMPQKLTAAFFALTLACSGLAFAAAPTSAYAADATTSVAEATQQKLNEGAQDAVYFKAVYSGDKIGAYTFVVSNSDLSDANFEFGSPNVDVSNTYYTVDLSSKGYRLAQNTKITFDGFGNRKVGYAFVGDEYVRYAPESLNADGTTSPEMTMIGGACTVNSIEFSDYDVMIYLDRIDSGASQVVMDAIDSIGEVTYTDECKAKLDDMMAAYQSLPEIDQRKVTNYNTLRSALGRYYTLKRAANNS